MKYQLIETIVLVEERRARSYGILLLDDEAAEEAVECITDISTCEAFVKELAERFNREGLSPLHFRDAVEDSLL